MKTFGAVYNLQEPLLYYRFHANQNSRNNTHINIMLLDEILDTLDEENSEIVVNMIKQLSNEHCILLISHTLKSCIVADEDYMF